MKYLKTAARRLLSRGQAHARSTAALFVLLAVFCLPVLASTANADLYQYRDRQGNIVITDKKPGPGYKAVKIGDTGKGEPAAPGPDEKGPQEPARDAQGGVSRNTQPAAIPGEPANTEAIEAQKRRNEEAARLEAEAREKTPFSKEKQIEQREMLEKANRLRKGMD